MNRASLILPRPWRKSRAGPAPSLAAPRRRAPRDGVDGAEPRQPKEEFTVGSRSTNFLKRWRSPPRSVRRLLGAGLPVTKYRAEEEQAL